MRTEHPSNELCRGEAKSFDEAMELVVEQCRHEAALFGADDPEYRRRLSELADQARRARAEYGCAVRDAELALAARWAHAPNGHVQEFAAALMSGDYSTLAI